ncbi:carboxylate-amine ligase [Nocardia beijingensis]|uniref:carboxylate-amine ligase n=1 Tax=Nocardia beijingensis TaxID=95162 RepID=UPI000836FDA9|nr:glutamate--cysteine ligase [Nocardia beijingensis]
MDDGRLTIGVEEEFLLVDPRTGEPLARNVEVARTAEDLGIDLQLELTRCQVETSTAVHTDIEALHGQLRELRRGIAACAERNDARMLAVGIPPTIPHEFPVTETPRYQRIEENFGMLAHEQGLSGCHVHIGIPDIETAIQVSNHLRPWLPHLLAMTANSAIYRGTETGFASWRSILWRRWPSAGPPPYFESARHYEAMVAMMLNSGSILDKQMVYWDVRPSVSFPTVEIRVSDIPATVEETALLAALVRAIVVMAERSLAAGRAAPQVSAEMLRAAYWKAARSGLTGDGVDPRDGTVAPVPDLLVRLIDHAAPALEEAGDRRFVDEAFARLLARGNGAHRQIAALRARGEIGDVVEEVARATLQGCDQPGNSPATPATGAPLN